MIDYAKSLFERYYRKGIIVDTNILLLYFIGQYNKELIPRFKRTSQFTSDDYDLLVIFLKNFLKIVTTPNILTEVSNLANQIPSNIKDDFFERFAESIVCLDEDYLESKTIAERDEFKKFGLTDSGIACLSQDDYLVLTDDLRLAYYLANKKVPVVNFNHLRQRIL